jgi:hypothetical protein
MIEKINWTKHVRNEVLQSQRQEEYPTNNKKMEGKLDLSHLA